MRDEILSSGENGFIKSHKQLLVEAEKKIAEMENERRLGIEHIQQLTWQVAQLRNGVAALATHFGQTPDQVKAIYDDYCAKRDEKINAEILARNEEAKSKFVEDIKAGKKVEFKAVDRNGGS